MIFSKKDIVTDSDKYREDKTVKHVKNLQRLIRYYEEGNIHGVRLQCRYLENEGYQAPRTVQEANDMVEVVGRVE